MWKIIKKKLPTKNITEKTDIKTNNRRQHKTHISTKEKKQQLVKNMHRNGNKLRANVKEVNTVNKALTIKK